MDLIPLIYMKNRKIHLEKDGEPISSKEFSNLVEDNSKIYILDIDGLEKDKPNLCTFQRFSSLYELWVDFGPRNLGDVVDATMAGATDITLRKNLCPQLNIADIKEITENKIYTNIDVNEEVDFEGSDGFVNFNSKEVTERDFKFGNSLKRLGVNNKIFSRETKFKNKSYWEYFGVEGLLVDLGKIKEFKNVV
jgi:uncharacterized protein related to proFAR isomerase